MVVGVTRVTRVQQQERTHERLLDAGRSVFLRLGFLAATVEEIAAEAGYTRGAVYKHFGGKEGLWQSIIEARTEAALLWLRDALDRAACRDELIDALSPKFFPHDDAGTRWATASVEFLAAIAAQPERAAAVAALQRRHDEAVVGLLDRNCQRLQILPAVPLPQLVVAWGALGGGLTLLRAVDPTAEVATVAAGVLAVLLPGHPTPTIESRE